MNRWVIYIRIITIIVIFMTTVTSTFGMDNLIRLKTRPGVTSSYWWMPRNGVATVLLFSGGEGGMGFKDGIPQSGNFLIRSREEFAKAGFNVALMGNASDIPKLNPELRISTEHLADIRATVIDLRNRSRVPIWLVGTSQGTISAVAAAIDLGTEIDGLVLTATPARTDHRGQSLSVSTLPLEKIVVPVLIHHHKWDACPATPSSDAQKILKRLTQSPVKKFMEVEGGKDPTGPPCQAFHYHGYIGIEQQVIEQIASWIKNPTP